MEPESSIDPYRRGEDPLPNFKSSFFVRFVPLADVAKGGDGAKSAFCGYFDLRFR
jgi:hypothetical protein